MIARYLAPALLSAALSVAATNASAMSPPFPQHGIAGVEDGKSLPFVGTWSMSLPADQHGKPDSTFATCAQPIRIEAADETHIFYLGPDEVEAEAATELRAEDGRTRWIPIEGGPEFLAVWIALDGFHLYEAGVEAAEDWGLPYIFLRCN